MKVLINKGRNYSGKWNINYVSVSNNICIMDNHRVAFWFWINNLNKTKKYRIIHADKHFVTQEGCLSEWKPTIPENLEELTLEQLMEIGYEKENFFCKTIQYDNYLTLFHEYYSDNVFDYFFFTHNVGKLPTKLDHLYNWGPNALIEQLPDLIFDCESKLIVNIDLDYFFVNGHMLLSDYSINHILKTIKKGIDKKNVEILTIALSPEDCENWTKSISFFNKYVSEILEIDKIKIPSR